MAKQWSIAVGGKASRDKGKRGEREAAAALREVLSIEARRGVQYQGGPDSPDVSTELDSQLHIEVKRTERLSLWDALDQAQKDAGDRPAMVLHRKNGKRWVVIHYLDDMPAISDAIKRR